MSTSIVACRRALLFLALFLLFASRAEGQSADAPGSRARGEELTVYVMTMGPGSMVWERFGHNAIWIRDRASGTDIAYNYGMFSFDQENFLLRFIRGHMDYWMEGFDAELTASSYIAADRSVWGQELNLTPDQRADLRDFLEWNALPENRVYRYDYYRDNCSTRVRDAIDLAIGGQLQERTAQAAAGVTYRDHTRALTASDPLLYSGLMAGLAQPVDVELSIWEEMFLPMQLRERIRGVMITGPDGAPIPLVRSEVEIYRSSVPDGGPIPPTREWLFLILGLAFGAAVYVSGRRAGEPGAGRITFGILAGGWALVAGLLGVILLGLWLFTDHATSYRNENLFFFTPLLLPLVGLLHSAVRGSRRAIRLATLLAGAVAVLSVLGLVLKALPWFVQVNGELLALALPVNIAIALATWQLGRGPQTSAVQSSPAGARHVEPAAARV